MLHAFIDEAGQRSATPKSSDHFVLSAVVVREAKLNRVAELHEQLRLDLRRDAGQVLHWKQMKMPDRLVAATALGSMPVKVASVIVFKRHLERLPHEDLAYMFTFRMLLERLSWIAEREREQLTYTLGHVVRFRRFKLSQYEDRLRSDGDCRVNWLWIGGRGRIDQPSRVEQLQLADIAASATFRAFESFDGSTDTSYVEAFASRLYRGTGVNRLHSYGLKFHPLTETTRAAHPWVAAL